MIVHMPSFGSATFTQPPVLVGGVRLPCSNGYMCSDFSEGRDTDCDDIVQYSWLYALSKNIIFTHSYRS